ncbi:MAG TPA: hypothetical protein VG939_22360 [Caulobacteraceae bacterium]|nr:hypothetical protein [Caulobacteraceae bacterium]
MHVELAEERILVLSDRVTMENAEARAWARRVEAFGTMAKLGGLLGKTRDDEYECVYRERRLQPFWRLSTHARFAYDRWRDYQIAVAPEVREVEVAGETKTVADRRITVSGLEHCAEEVKRDLFFDGLTGQPDPKLAVYLDFHATQATADTLAAAAKDGTVVVPPQVRASGLVRDAVADSILKVDADKVLEETVRLEAVDLVYRPVYAFRYRRQGKEAVVEFDALTGEVKTTGSTFEQHLGKILEPKFLLDVGAEAANLFIPGATIAKIVLVKGMEMRERRAAEREG